LKSNSRYKCYIFSPFCNHRETALKSALFNFCTIIQKKFIHIEILGEYCSKVENEKMEKRGVILCHCNDSCCTN